MDRVKAFAIFVFVVLCAPLAAHAADKGKIVYGVSNCFVIETSKGNTLFERSGGQLPKPGDTATGVLHDFGYQQLYDANGKDLMVGYVQDYGVRKGEDIEAFKKSCR